MPEPKHTSDKAGPDNASFVTARSTPAATIPPEHPPGDLHWNYRKSRRSLRFREPRSGGMCLRIVLWASLLATLAYAAYDPAAMRLNTALVTVVGVAGGVAVVQLYMVVTRFARALPYSTWFVVLLDALSVAGWVAAIAVLSYWHLRVLYRPNADTDPASWSACYGAANKFKFLDPKYGVSEDVSLIWCPVRVDGRDRLIGNGAARVQHRAIIGLASVTLLFNTCALLLSVKKACDPHWCRV